jgi:hypothetical protein
VAQTISGYKTRAVFDRYDITTTEDLKLAIRRQHEYLAATADEKAFRESRTIVAIDEKTSTAGRA